MTRISVIIKSHRQNVAVRKLLTAKNASPYML